MPSGRGRTQSQASDCKEFLELISSLNSARRNSTRSQSARHTWRSGLIPPCLESPHRIPSRFPVPPETMARVPGLRHPDLNPGQRQYLQSTAQTYSLDRTKRALSDSYYGLLMSELMKGGGGTDSHMRYSGWIYGNHKRLFETNPAIWRSRKLPKGDRGGSEEGSRRHKESQERGTGERRREEPKPSRRHREQTVEDRKSTRQHETKEGQEGKEETQQQKQQQQQRQQRLQSSGPRRRQQRSAIASDKRQKKEQAEDEDSVNYDKNDEGGGIRVAEAGEQSRSGRQQLRQPSARHRTAKRDPSIEVAATDEDDDPDSRAGTGNKDKRRPKDLSQIMY